jgi:hypothetical protein
MAIMMGRLYAALREANVAEDRAREAAEEAASFENRLAGVEARLLVLTWMVGFNLAMTAAIVARLFTLPHS